MAIFSFKADNKMLEQRMIVISLVYFINCLKYYKDIKKDRVNDGNLNSSYATSQLKN